MLSLKYLYGSFHYFLQDSFQTSSNKCTFPNNLTHFNHSLQFSSVAKSCPTLQPHGLQYARLPCPLPTPGAYSNSCPSSQWCHLTTSSSVVPFSSCLQSFPASGSFQISQLFASAESFWVAKVFEFQLQHQSSNEYSGLISFRIDCLDLLAVQGTLKSRLQHHSSKASILQRSTFFTVQLSHPYMTPEKNHSFD